MTALWTEQVLQLGPEQNLLALWTQPADGPAPLTVVFINAGVIHRIGPHRLHVKLARQLARQGIASVRFDLSGGGDSRVPDDAADFRVQAVRDIRTVVDHLTAKPQVSDVVLVGLCSGAAHAQAAALADERVKGVFLIDGYMYPTWRGRWHFLRLMMAAYGARVTLQRLTRGLAQMLRRAIGTAPSPSEAPPEPHLSATQFSRDMQALYQRQVRVSLLFTGSVLEVFSYPEQLAHQFAGAEWLEHVRCYFEPEVDHTLTLSASQALLERRLGEWLDGLKSVSAQPSRGVG